MPPTPSDVLWQRPGASAPSPLEGDTRADVAIVGGGVAGLTCARMLAAAGREVVLLERERCGAGASGRSSGFVTPDSELSLAALLERKGEADARVIWRFVESGVDDLREVIQAHDIDCDALVAPSFLAASRRAGVGAVEAEHAARAALGLSGRLLSREEIPGDVGTGRFHAALTYEGTFAMDPFAFCRGLAGVVRGMGVRIHEATAATEIRPDRVLTPGGTVTARHVVVCTDRSAPSLGLLTDDVFPLQTFLLATTPLSSEDLRRVFPGGPRMVWDTDLVYHYLRPTGDGRLLLGGGSVATTYRRPDDRDLPRMRRRLLRRFRRWFPGIAVEADAVWSGRLGVSRDLLPVLCRSEDGLVVISAATGLPWAAALGRFAAESLTTGRSEMWGFFPPGRDYPVSGAVQGVIGRPLSFALSHAAVKRG